MQFVESGGPGWLHLLAVLFIYNAVKFAIMGPASLVVLLRARFREDDARRREQRAKRRPIVATQRRVMGAPLRRTAIHRPRGVSCPTGACDHQG